MAFPRKFKERLELKRTDLTLPSEAWVVYAVCGCEKDACGWEGWILDSVKKKAGRKCEELPSDQAQRCPACGRSLFRTSVSVRLTPSKNQKPALIPGVDYRSARVPYESDRRTSGQRPTAVKCPTSNHSPRPAVAHP